jgi:hypothetical protein
VADYARISLFDVSRLCYYDYLVLLRDAVIYHLSQSEGGRDYLEQCWVLEQTTPDRGKLRARFGKEETTHGR